MLDFWLHRTGPILANYGPNFEFWCDEIPTWAWHSNVVRHLLVAATLADEQLGIYESATTSKLSPTTIWHYHSAIKTMAEAKEPDKSCLLMASLLGWVFETLQRRYWPAQVHMAAAKNMLADLEQSSSKRDFELAMRIKPTIQLSASFQAAMSDDTASFHSARRIGLVGATQKANDTIILISLEDARDLVFDSISSYLSEQRTELAALEQRWWIRRWHIAFRDYCSRTTAESCLYKRAIRILFNLAMSFLPESEVGSFSYSATSNALRHPLNAFDRVLTETQAQKPRDRKGIEETLLMAVECMKKHDLDDDLSLQADQLLEKLRNHQGQLPTLARLSRKTSTEND